MNKPKRPLRSTLEELTSSLVDAILVSARESLFNLAAEQASFASSRAKREPARRAERAVVPSAPKAAAPKSAARNRARSDRTGGVGGAGRTQTASSPPPEGANDLLITDPLALLAALDTAGPSRDDYDYDDAPAETREREVPALLQTEPSFAPPPAQPRESFTLREGEVIVRRSAGGVVLRRRRA